jgi:hypothetical protein
MVGNLRVQKSNDGSMTMTKLTDHWTLEELVFSDIALRHGIDNTAPQSAIDNLRLLAVHCLEPLRILVARPMFSNSGFRCDELNALVKGKPDSQHRLGQAADVVCPGMSIDDLYTVAEKNIPFDQLIFEGTWLHLSYRVPCRGEVWLATFVNGTARYTLQSIGGVSV